MYLNTLSPALGSRHNAKRVGRGVGSGIGKTCGRGHKGQGARSGSSNKAGFEGGQMPMYRRIPKRGFHAKVNDATQELRLSVLEMFPADCCVTVEALRDCNFIRHNTKRVRIIFDRPIEQRQVQGLYLTKGSRPFVTEVTVTESVE